MKYFAKSLAIFLQIPNTSIEQIGSSHNNLGICFFRKGDEEKAFEYLHKALQLFSQVLDEDHPQIASIYLNIGVYYANRGDFEHGLNYFHRSLNIFLKSPEKHQHRVSILYNNIGSCYNETKDYDNALQSFEKALSIRIAISGEQNQYCSRICENIGTVYVCKNNKSKALEYLNRALDICCNTIGEQHQEVVNIYKNIALCYDLDSTERLLYFQKSLALSLKTFDTVHKEKASVYIEIGNYYNTKQNSPEALQHYQFALQSLNLPVSDTNFYALPTLKNYTHAYFLLETLRGKAIVFYNMYRQDNLPQNLIASLAHYHCADALIAQMRQSYKAEGSKLTLGSTGKNNIYQPAIDRTWLAYQQETQNNLSVAQIAAQMGYQLPTTIELAFMFAEKKPSYALFYQPKNEEAKATAQLPEQLRQQEYQLRVELNYLDTKIAEGNQDHEQVQKWQKQYFDYKQQYNQLIETFEKEYPDYYQIKYDNQIVSINQVQKILPANTTLMEYFVSDEQLYVFCITPKNSHFIALNTNPTTLNTAIEALLKNITNSRPTVGGRNAFANASHQLYQLVFEPIVSYLPPNCQQLIIIPTNNLSQLPFEALLTNAVANGTHYHNMPYLGTQYAIQYHYSATLWHYGSTKQKTTYAQPNAAQGSYLGFAPVVYNTAETNDSTEIKKEIVQLRGLDYVALPHTETEVQEVSKLLAQKGYQSDVYLRKTQPLSSLKIHCNNILICSFCILRLMACLMPITLNCRVLCFRPIQTKKY
ncbi:MAG: tetratricopeptide repeat protein [Sphingobacteriales bacterium]|nr:tetratricopeptide repeat protein [Sphingobacteriales bacterium]